MSDKCANHSKTVSQVNELMSRLERTKNLGLSKEIYEKVATRDLKEIDKAILIPCFSCTGKDCEHSNDKKL